MGKRFSLFLLLNSGLAGVAGHAARLIFEGKRDRASKSPELYSDFFPMGMIACPTLRNSQMTARKAEANPVFTSLQYCCSIQPQKHATLIGSLTQSLLGADKATISHFKEEILGHLKIPKI